MTRNDIALIRQRALFNGQVTRAEVVALCNEYVIGPDMRAGEKRAEPCVVVRVEAIA